MHRARLLLKKLLITAVSIYLVAIALEKSHAEIQIWSGLPGSWGTSEYVQCELNFEGATPRQVSRRVSQMHGEAKGYLERSWFFVRMNRDFEVAVRNDTVNLSQYRDALDYGKETPHMLDLQTRHFMRGFRTHMEQVGQEWTGPIVGRPQQREVPIMNNIEGSWPIQVRSRNQADQPSEDFDGFRMDLLMGPGSEFTRRFPDLLERVMNRGSLAFLAVDPTITIKVTIGHSIPDLAGSVATPGTSISDVVTEFYKLDLTSQLYPAVERALQATRERFANPNLRMNWMRIPSEVDTNGMIVTHDNYYFQLVHPDLRWGGVRESLFFFKTLHDEIDRILPGQI